MGAPSVFDSICNGPKVRARPAGRTRSNAARAGDPALVSGYIGEGKAFEEAISAFAVAYADQTETDWQSFEAAIRTGRIIAASRKRRRADSPSVLWGNMTSPLLV
jgi:hypothetical protein